jgi:hypothetical protein
LDYPFHAPSPPARGNGALLRLYLALGRVLDAVSYR